MSLARISQIVGTVLQDPERQILGSRVYNEVAFGLENLGLSRGRSTRRTDAALEYLGISDLAAERRSACPRARSRRSPAGILAMQPSIPHARRALASLTLPAPQETLGMVRPPGLTKG